MPKPSWSQIILVALLVVVAWLVGRITAYTPPPLHHDEDRNNALHEKSTREWLFTNPLLDCTDLNTISDARAKSMEVAVRDFTNKEQKNGLADSSIYFRDLKNGPWFAVNSQEPYLPASLLKVPLMMSAFHEEMSDPGFLKKKVVYSGGSLNNEYYKAPQELQDGKEYTIEEVVESMIRNSDNNASHVLSYAIDSDHLLESYQYLGVPSPSQTEYQISTRDYASFFRVLYNSTFLTPELSEKALSLLSETKFDDGLVAGVPVNVKVAHKFGERQIGNGIKQLHDCGIVYYPDNPYVLCVMTRGSDFVELAKVIKNISNIVYTQEDKEFRIK